MMTEAMYIPNNTSLNSPVGDETNNKLVYSNHQLNDIKNTLDKNNQKNAISHIDLLEKFDLTDFDNAAKIAGSKFVFLKNELVFLELALIQFTLCKLRQKGYQILSTPELVKNELILGCGFNPRDPNKNQIYSIDDGELSLIGTSELSLMGILANEVVNKKHLPLKLCGISHCFRREAGRGNMSKGLYRLHQFSKVEMFAFTEGELKTSEDTQLEMVEIQKEIYNELGIKFRVLEMATEELGSSAYRKFDIEAWFPSLQDYGEISSCSNCTDYQSKRLLSQYWDVDLETKKPIKKLVHTINGTALAVPRIIMYILENNLNNNEIIIPQCLIPFMCGITKISIKPNKQG